MSEVFKAVKEKAVTGKVELSTHEAHIEFIVPMEYTARGFEPTALAAGEYRGLKFYVVSLGTHPCAYVNVAKTRFDGMSDDEMDNTGIECHGGFTYAKSTLCVTDEKGWFVGWDYAHCEDWSGYMELYKGEYGETHLQRHYTAEMIRDCMDVIDQIMNRTKEAQNGKEA